MFTNQDVQNLMAQREAERQELLARAEKQPVWLTKIQFGNATAFRLEAGHRIMGEKVAFYGYFTRKELILNAEAELQNALSAGLSANPTIVDHRSKGEIIAFIREADIAAYDRYCQRRQLTVLFLVMVKMGAGVIDL